MPRSSNKVYETRYPYFITCSIVEWLPLFSIPELTEIVLECLQFHQDERDLILHAYVIMENHLHLIARSEKLQKRMRTFKSYTARKIIDHLKMNDRRFYLHRLKALKLANHEDSEFQVWQEGYHPKQIVGNDMMTQKVKYIHQNPVKRGYVDRPEQWRYSSARNYLGKEGLIPVTLIDPLSM